MPERLLALVGVAGAILVGWAAATAPESYSNSAIAVVVLAVMFPFNLAALMAWVLRQRGDRKVAEYDAIMARIGGGDGAD